MSCQKGGEGPGVVSGRRIQVDSGGGVGIWGVDLEMGRAWVPLPRRGPMLVVFQITHTLGGTAEGANREKRRSVDWR